MKLDIEILSQQALNLSKSHFLEEINILKQKIDVFRPFPEEVWQRIFQKLRLEWNYHSNAIEGNSLTYGETIALLMHGVTAKGKPLKDHLDIKGHNEAIYFLAGLVKEERDLNEADIRALHELILKESYEVSAQTLDGKPTKKRISIGKYKTLPNHVITKTGETHYYANPEEVPMLMQDLLKWYQLARQSQIHPLVLASIFHHQFTAIHPFDDGNRRLARILMNFILMRHQYPPIVVKKELRDAYYGALSQADAGIFEPLIEYMSEPLLKSLDIQLRALNGEDISELADLDKEIALFKMEMGKDIIAKERNKDIIHSILKNSIISILKDLNKRLFELNDLFFDTNHIVYVDIKNNHLQMTMNDDFYKKILTIENIATIQISYQYYNFKKIQIPFSLQIEVFISFEQFHYEISYNNNIFKIKKLYNENINNQEINEIIKEILQFVMLKIKDLSNSQSK
jgi:Fic family protein